ncbi:MAG TPA: DUF2905 domain-containing protein [Acetivibrio sp.]|nr:DUF2905 domain-containing protein [Clostridium sp.]HOQ37066.1 DUF2905 domain-containing protein [Acetivibrio sp.]HPT91002.1 DUF2905 domain-containing protein [Acetivibrio sp.]HQA57250.1 DUF2905 domain-containing protein [Acetivibrio sp.]
MYGFQTMGKMLIIIGAVSILVGILVYLGGRLGLGKLPGDILYSKGNFTFYFPLATSLIISLILTAIMFLLRLRNR